MKYIYKLTLLITLTVCTVRSFAQQENTLYFMERLPQSQYLNPANHPDCKWWLGGLLVPVWTSPMIDPPFIHFPMYLDFSVPISLSDVILYKNNKPSSTFLENATTQDAFLKKLSPINYISNNMSIEWLNLGFKQKKNYWDLCIMTKGNLNFSFPKELFTFPLKGNFDSLRADNGTFDGFGLNTSVYQEASIGFNRQFSKYFRMGIRVKAIYGIANISTSTSRMQLNTITRNEGDLKSGALDYTPYTVENNVNMVVNASVPMLDIQTDTNNLPKSVSAKNGYSLQDALKMKNYGWGLDFGFQKDWNSELTFYGSVIDFGFIKWQSNVQNFDLNGKYTFNGIKMSNFNLNGLNVDTMLSEFTNGYKAKYTQTSYKTSLSTKAFFGGNYKLTKKIAIGLLGRIDKYPYNYQYSATASLNLKPFRWGALTLSSSYIKKSFANFGIGYTIRLGAIQWYAIYDNMIGAAAMPEKARYFTLRWGVNLVFGRGKKKVIESNKPLLNTL